MKRTALLLMILTILSKILGFGREIVLSYFYGASEITDIYLIAITIPSVIFGFIGGAIGTGYVPMYSKIEELEGTKKANRYTNNLINILLLMCTVMFVLGLVFTGPLVKLFASGFTGESLTLAVKFTRVSLLGIYFTALIAVFGRFLEIKDNYAIPALIGFPMNIITIIAIVISSKGNPMFLIIGTVVATASQLLFIMPWVYKKGYKYRPVFNIKDKHIRQMAIIALPLILGSSVSHINTLVDRTIASTLATGAITALNYASKINGFVEGIFIVSITTAMYPLISRMAAMNDRDGLKKTINEAIISVSLLVVPATVGAMVFAEPVVSLLFGRGQFGPKALEMTSTALFFYSLGMIAFGLRNILSRAFYSMQNTRTPAINAAIGVVINIVLNIILSKYMGIGGLALATSISALVVTGLLFFSLRIELGAFGMRKMTLSFGKILGSSLVMGLAAKLAFNLTINSLGQNLALFVAIGVGALVYFVLIFFMKIDEVDSLVLMVKSKISS